ncbi:hypothetical protein [Virgibacillus sp. L01]|uniref:hypothetical protein n=1 Tax=Virgibacillus sp. L01 TaxID=3457429 RepID=UPI003FCFCE94
MSEQNKNRNRDTGKQQNVLKYDTEPKREKKDDTEIADDTEFLNLDNKRNKRKR